MLGKRGRRAGARRGGGKRFLPPPAPPPSSLRPAAGAAGTRLPIAPSGAARNRRGTSSPAPAPPDWEETFSLQPGDPNFAAIIRLTPDVVEEIRRVEAEGGTARIKFDPSSNNVSGNVIDICGKEFRFTWSREFGDLCDIYEERPNGNDGHGLLIESGSAWRKLNVERVLDESTKNHVKMRSVEAERLSKSRKAIVLDPANPSVKNQVKSMAAAGVEGTMRRTNLKQKKEPLFKKRKFEPTQGASSKSTGKIRLSTSPPMSPHHQQGHDKFDSPFGASSYSIPEVRSASVNINEENIGSLEKEIPVVLPGTKHDTIGRKWVIGEQSMDLGSILVTLLSEKPEGMTIKALKKAVGEAIPNSAEKIRSAVKNIATFTAMGRYILKPRVEVESSKRLVSEKESSTESVDDHTAAAKSTTLKRTINEKYGQKTQLNLKVHEHSDLFEKIETNKHEHPYTSDRKAYFSEGRPCSPSGSGSDSKSRSDTDSGSDIGTESRSSNAGSGSPSCSDSSSWNDGSDEEVEIMTGNGQKDGEQKREATELKLTSSTGTAFHDDCEPIDITANNLEGNVSLPPLVLNAYEATEESPINNNIVTSKIFKSETSKCAEMDQYQTNSMLPDIPSQDQYKQSENKQTSPDKKTLSAYKQVVNQSSNEKQTLIKEGHVHQHTEVPEISKLKLKRVSNSEYLHDKLDIAKKLKATSSTPAVPALQNRDGTSQSTLYISPDISGQETYIDHTVQAAHKVKCDVNTGIGSQGSSIAEHGMSAVSKDAHRMQQRPDVRSSSFCFDVEHSQSRNNGLSCRKEAFSSMENSVRYSENLGNISKSVEGLSCHPYSSEAPVTKNMHAHDQFSSLKDKQRKDILLEAADASKKYPVKNVRENLAADKMSFAPESYSISSAETCGDDKDNQQCKSGRDKSLAVGRKAIVLGGELSVLELGEFREPPGKDSGGIHGQLNRRGSLKSFENSATATDNASISISKGRLAASAHELSTQSPTNLMTGVKSNQDVFNRRLPIEDSVDQTPLSAPFQSQQLSKVNHADTEALSLSDKSAETTGRKERIVGLGNYIGSHNKMPANIRPQHCNKNGERPGSKIVDGSKLQKSATILHCTNQYNNNFFIENHNNDRNRGESFYEYDKDRPELQDQIKDFPTWRECVNEYHEKYDLYFALRKNLENTMNTFIKISNDLEVAKGRNKKEYGMLAEKLKAMYHECGESHKQMKKTFILLHDELKYLKQRIKDYALTHTKE